MRGRYAARICADGNGSPTVADAQVVVGCEDDSKLVVDYVGCDDEADEDRSVFQGDDTCRPL